MEYKTTSRQPMNNGKGWVRALWDQGWLKGLLLVVAVIFAYQPVWHAGFIWDDAAHVTRPDLRSLGGLARIWIQLGTTQQYYPLTHSVFWVEHELWGDSASGYHLVNILLHVFSALLLVRLLRQLKIPGAWLAAYIFALHPIQVESVAWISELKNTLSGVFYLGAALVYVGFDRTRSRGKYALALGLFLLGLMSKTVIATLPAALLAVFWWQHGKLFWRRDVRPLVPFFIAGIGAGLFTAWVERKFVGAEGSEFNFSIIERALIAGRVIWFYLGKLFWPANLAFIYPRWNVSQTMWWQYLFPAATLGLLIALAWLQRRWRGPLAGLLFFAGTLFPALGFFNVYPFRFSLVADHFQYLASIGPIVLVAAGISTRFSSFRKWRSFWEPALYGTLLAVLCVLTWQQSRTYRSDETLWRTTVERNPNSWMAHNTLGRDLERAGKLDEASQQYVEAQRLGANHAEPYTNLGNILARQGRLGEAMENYRQAIQASPSRPDGYWNMGTALESSRNIGQAIQFYTEALQRATNNVEMTVKILNHLGVIQARSGNLDEAIQYFRAVTRAAPSDLEAYINLGHALTIKGQNAEAIQIYRRTIELAPNSPEMHFALARALAATGQKQEAVAQLTQALQLKPDYLQAQDLLNKLGTPAVK